MRQVAMAGKQRREKCCGFGQGSVNDTRQLSELLSQSWDSKMHKCLQASKESSLNNV
jgi:hypothetical protein